MCVWIAQPSLHGEMAHTPESRCSHHGKDGQGRCPGVSGGNQKADHRGPITTAQKGHQKPSVPAENTWSAMPKMHGSVTSTSYVFTCVEPQCGYKS